MNKHWEVIIDEKTFEIYKDEKTSEECWEFYSSTPEHKGYGVVATTRDICIKKLIKRYKKELEEEKKLLKTRNKNFEKLMTQLKKEMK